MSNTKKQTNSSSKETSTGKQNKNSSEKQSEKEGQNMWQKIGETFLKSILIPIAKDYMKDYVKKSPELFSKLKKWFYGKNIGILGATASGKNSFFNRLKGKDLDAQYAQTRGTEKVETFEISYRLSENDYIKFKCKNAVNVGGETDEKDRYWSDIAKSADILFYLIDIEKIEQQNEIYIERLRDDLFWLRSHNSQMKPNSKLYLILNKIDVLVGDYKTSEDYENHISESIKHSRHLIENIVKNIFENTNKTDFNFISGIYPISMKDKYLFDKYFFHIISDIYNKESEK